MARALQAKMTYKTLDLRRDTVTQPTAAIRAGVAAALGIVAGCFVHIAAAALGLSALVADGREVVCISKAEGKVTGSD